MNSFFEFVNSISPIEKTIIGVIGVLILVAIAVYLIQLVRGIYNEDRTDHWSSFRQMREDGTLREYEYQHLRKKMAEKKIANENENSDPEAETMTPDFEEKND